MIKQMGYFAVLGNPKQPSFEVTRLHINFWCLRGLSRWTFVCDLGLKLRVLRTDGIGYIELLLPIAPDDQMVDLFDVMSTEDGAGIVFNQPVQIRASGHRAELILEKETLHLVRVNTGQAQTTRVAGRDDLWRCRIPLLAAVEPSTHDTYLRFRIFAGPLGSLWAWKKTLLSHNGAFVDLRVADVRDTADPKSDRELAKQILPIQRLDLFVVAPWTLQLKTVNPPLRQTRIIEGDAWSTYLHRRVNIGRRAKSIVYTWRHPEGRDSTRLPGGPSRNDNQTGLDHHALTESINVYSPFRAFLELGREASLSPIGEYVRIAVFVTVAIALLPSLRNGFQWILGIDVPWKDILSIIGIPTAGIITVLAFLGGARRWLLSKIRMVARMERRLERWVLRS